MIKTQFQFGEKIKVIGSIIRCKEGYSRTWIRFPRNSEDAIFLNGVNLADGKINHDDDCEITFEPNELIPGAWICRYNRKPEKVFLADCVKVEIK